MRAALLAVLLATVTGCAASSQAPRGFVTDRAGEPFDVRGAWVRAEVAGLGVLQGELLALDADSLWVLTQADSLAAVARPRVGAVRVEAYTTKGIETAGWPLVGALSAVTHGYLLVFTAPFAWGIAGIETARVHSGQGVVRTELQEEIDGLGRYARFPQGLPAGLDRSRLTFPWIR